jgi:hypothetical protein
MIVYVAVPGGVDIRVHHSDSALDLVPVDDVYYRLDHGQSHRNINAKKPTGYLRVTRRSNSNVTKGGPFSNSAEIVITPSGNGLSLVNWTNERKRLMGAGNPTARTEEIEESLEIASGILTALATGVAALGPKGALPAGMLLGVGSLILTAMGRTAADPPPAPDIAAIRQAVEEVIHEALGETQAKSAAVALVLGANWLERMTRRSHSALLGVGNVPAMAELGSVDYWEIFDNVKDHLNGQFAFQNALGTLYQHADWAQFAIPSLMTGIATNLQMERLWDFIRHLHGARITTEDLQEYLMEIAEADKALAAAVARLTDTIDRKVAAAHLTGSGQGEEYRRFLIARYMGKPDFGAAEDFRKELGQLQDKLAEDVAALEVGKPMQHYWPEAWDRIEKAPIPPRPGMGAPRP